VGRYGLAASGLREGPMASSYEHSNEPLGSIKGKKFLDQLS
jgi:hypothetical protein